MKSHLVITSRNWAALREHLFTSDGKENGAFLLCGRSQDDESLTLLAHTVLPVPLDAYRSRLRNHLEISPDFINQVITLAISRQWSILAVHSHPAASRAVFSASDDAGENRLMPVLASLLPIPHGALLLTPQDWAGRIWHDAEVTPLDFVAVRGSALSTRTRSIVTGGEPGAYERQRRVWGSSGQAFLADLRVGIVGLGGTGSCVAEQLCRLGVRDFILVDPDRLEDSNRSRMYGVTAEDAVGTPKAELVARHLNRVAVEQIRMRAVVESAVAQECLLRLRDRDVVLCCTDNLLSRAVLNRFAYQYLIPVIDMGVRIDVRGGQFKAASGRVTLVGPDLACLLCSGHLNPDILREELLSTDERQALTQEGYIQGHWDPQPAVISLNSTASSLAVTALLNLVTRMFPPLVEQIYDVASGGVFVVGARHAPRCEVCAPNGPLGRGDSQPVSTVSVR